MANTQLVDCSSASNGASSNTTPTQSTSGALQRVNFFNRQLLTAEDMTVERDYFLQKVRRHNRFLHGWGVVCGLKVSAAFTPSTPWRVQIASGYALGPYGDEIFVGNAVYFDLAACISGSGTTNPCEPNMVQPGGAGVSSTAYLAIQYAECLARPVQVASSGCGCDVSPCQYSRIVDSFQLQCLAQLPQQPPYSPPTLCQVNAGTIPVCPPCPTSSWVVLAKIDLPSSTSQRLQETDIHMSQASGRRILVSTAVLQDQVVSCCCNKTSPPPPPGTVDIASIMVSPPGQNEWTTDLELLLTTPPVFDYLLTLTDPAPEGGLQITVTGSGNGTVALSNSSPVVPASQTTLVVPKNSATFNSLTGGGVTLAATDPSGVSATATLQPKG